MDKDRELPLAHGTAKSNNNITIRVSYSWAKGDDDAAKHPRSDERWKALRNLLQAVGDEAISLASKVDANNKLVIRIGRLRARHGMQLTSTLSLRIKRADILVADIAGDDPSGCNPNVMTEVGIAIGAGLDANGCLFLMKPTSLEAPSDLRGTFWTNYDLGDGKLVDHAGFRAALRTQILELAYAKGLIGSGRGPSVDFIDDPDDGPPARA